GGLPAHHPSLDGAPAEGIHGCDLGEPRLGLTKLRSLAKLLAPPYPAEDSAREAEARRNEAENHSSLRSTARWKGTSPTITSPCIEKPTHFNQRIAPVYRESTRFHTVKYRSRRCSANALLP